MTIMMQGIPVPYNPISEIGSHLEGKSILYFNCVCKGINSALSLLKALKIVIKNIFRIYQNLLIQKS